MEKNIMHFERSSGILFHPTSLPGRYGIGDLGTAAYQFVDFLVDAGQTMWQILPLGPTGYGNSPYQSPSAFAGNPLLISLDRMVEENLLESGDMPDIPEAFYREDRVNYDAVASYKYPLLKRSFERLRASPTSPHTKELARFCKEQSGWLDDYALFMALTEHFEKPWYQWDRDISLRESPAAIEQWQKKLSEQIEFRKYMQYLFFTQWLSLKSYANSRGVRIIGDIPIYVSFDSADVWANPDMYKLDKDGNPTVVAGVPPDYFSATGQRWGNPIYRWDQMSKRDFDWWIARMKQTLTVVDIVRIDHFRGLESYWEVPASEETAVNGKWVKAPGTKFFNTLNSVFGELPIIAEDLGLITPEVEKLRDKFKLPGMKVLHFAFGDTSDNPYLPHNYEANFVAYTGTHDNDTTIGWFEKLPHDQREAVQCYMGREGSDIAWELMRLAMMSVAEVCIVPLQDVLRLGSESRMNTPGTIEGNWEWRLPSRTLTPGIAQGLRTLTKAYGRCKE
jgi:4-alpha-glucanotransferase